MWDPRYGDQAALHLAEARAAAPARRSSSHRVRRAVGGRLVSWGERLLAPAAHVAH
jgi:hypothetical protein